MIKYIIALPDGTEIGSGPGTKNAIKTVSHTEITNDQTDLSLGSVCSAFAEVTLITPGGGLYVASGSDFTLYRVDGESKTKIGLFTAEKPVRRSANIYKITGYDRVSWLDKDLTDWLSALTGWPYRIGDLASMVCAACGVEFATANFPNDSFYTHRPSLSGGVTGRQLLRWIAEIAGRFCVANADGALEFRWYEQSGKTIEPSGPNFFYGGSLSYADYNVSKIDSVKIRLAESDDGALWPEGTANNPYVITGNRLLLTNITEATKNVLSTILQGVANAQYTPCNIIVPADRDIKAGQIVNITDKNGKSISTYVMKAVHSGQKTKLESTGYSKRNSSEALNYLTNQSLKDYADATASGAVHAQTQEDIFNKLTNSGTSTGVYLENGILYINADYIKSGFISSDIIRAGKIRSTDFAVEELQEIYPDNSMYPSNASYPNNGEQIIRGVEIDFASGIIRGVFWSESIAELENKVTNLDMQLSYAESAINSLQKTNAELQQSVNALENDLSAQQEYIDDLETEVVNLKTAESELDMRLLKLETGLIYPKSM